MKREKTVIDVEVSEEKQKQIVSSLLREHTNVGMKFERERTRQEEMVRPFILGPESTLHQRNVGGFLFEEKTGREITRGHRFRKASFSKCFSSTRKRKFGVFKFLWFEERFVTH